VYQQLEFNLNGIKFELLSY